MRIWDRVPVPHFIRLGMTESGRRVLAGRLLLLINKGLYNIQFTWHCVGCDMGKDSGTGFLLRISAGQ